LPFGLEIHFDVSACRSFKTARFTIGGSIPDALGGLVALPPVADLLFFAKHLFVAAMVAIAPAGRVNDEQWDRFSPEFQTGLGFNPDGGRGS
jgi:hypothetical protein